MLRLVSLPRLRFVRGEWSALDAAAESWSECRGGYSQAYGRCVDRSTDAEIAVCGRVCTTVLRACRHLRRSDASTGGKAARRASNGGTSILPTAVRGSRRAGRGGASGRDGGNEPDSPSATRTSARAEAARAQRRQRRHRRHGGRNSGGTAAGGTAGTGGSLTDAQIVPALRHCLALRRGHPLRGARASVLAGNNGYFCTTRCTAPLSDAARSA